MSCTSEESIQVAIGADDVTRIALYQYAREPFPPAWWAAITKVVVTVGDASLDSSVDVDAVSWDEQALDLKLGNASGLVTGWAELRLRVYHADTPGGRAVWAGLPSIEVIE
ncbi:MAG: hypothetical protein ACWA5X_05725 [bacterium]